MQPGGEKGPEGIRPGHRSGIVEEESGRVDVRPDRLHGYACHADEGILNQPHGGHTGGTRNAGGLRFGQGDRQERSVPCLREAGHEYSLNFAATRTRA